MQTLLSHPRILLTSVVLYRLFSFSPSLSNSFSSIFLTVSRVFFLLLYPLCFSPTLSCFKFTFHLHLVYVFFSIHSHLSFSLFPFLFFSLHYSSLPPLSLSCFFLAFPSPQSVLRFFFLCVRFWLSFCLELFSGLLRLFSLYNSFSFSF